MPVTFSCDAFHLQEMPNWNVILAAAASCSALLPLLPTSANSSRCVLKISLPRTVHARFAQFQGSSLTSVTPSRIAEGCIKSLHPPASLAKRRTTWEEDGPPVGFANGANNLLKLEPHHSAAQCTKGDIKMHSNGRFVIDLLIGRLHTVCGWSPWKELWRTTAKAEGSLLTKQRQTVMSRRKVFLGVRSKATNWFRSHCLWCWPVFFLFLQVCRVFLANCRE